MMKIFSELPEHWFWLFAVAAIALSYNYMGNGDYAEAVKAQQVYCDNVASGAWPDYKEADCK
ncbi:MAG: hypothetical protein Unbinned8622contig1005_12 [Prokaryotic dsDNA virus sp.]|nr:MAG: hypothetical protein Unbinned8622contig1005_12 [Prokaryotic dsDNA virus sp.]